MDPVLGLWSAMVGLLIEINMLQKVFTTIFLIHNRRMRYFLNNVHIIALMKGDPTQVLFMLLVKHLSALTETNLRVLPYLQSLLDSLYGLWMQLANHSS